MTKQIKFISFNLILFGLVFLVLLLLYSNSSAFNFTSILTISLAIIGGLGLLFKSKYGWFFANTICVNFSLILFYAFISSIGESESLSHSGIIISLLFSAISLILIYSVFYLNIKRTIDLFSITNAVRLASFILAIIISTWEIFNMQ